MAIRSRRIPTSEGSKTTEITEKNITQDGVPTAEVKPANGKLLAGVAAALAILSASFGWDVARQYENNIWDPLLSMGMQLGVTLLLSFVVVSPLTSLTSEGGFWAAAGEAKVDDYFY